MPKSARTGIARIVHASRYSWCGLKAAFRLEAAFRFELLLAAILIPAGIWIGESGAERAVLIGSVLLVLTVELLNSAVEAIADRFGDEWTDLCGRAKDMGSAAVMIALVNLGAVWAFIVWDRLA